MALFQPSISALTSLKSTPKTILITGGSSGIGLATATLLSTLNPKHNLILLDLQPPPASFTHPPEHLVVHTCNITSWASQRAGFDAGYAGFGRIDAVFVNAGIGEHGDQFFIDTLDSSGKLAEPDRRTLNLDMDAASDTTKLAIHYLRKNSGSNNGGSIILTASLASYLAFAGAPLYSAAKHGVVGLMRALKQDCAKLSISISVVAPAITVTPILTANNPNLGAVPPEAYARDMAKAGVPINKPQSVALAVCWLLNQGMQANGAGILVQADRFSDIERGLAESREAWMGKEMLGLFRGGRTAPLAVPLFARLDRQGGGDSEQAKAKM